MNIKYISLLSLFVAVAANAKQPITTELDNGRNNYSDCRKIYANISSLTQLYCATERRFFENTKNEFVKAHAENAKKMKQAMELESENIRYHEQHSFPWKHYSLKNARSRWEEANHQHLCHRRIIDILNTQEEDNIYTNSGQSIVDLSEQIIDAARPMLTNNSALVIEAQNEGKKRAKEFVQQQAQTPAE